MIGGGHHDARDCLLKGHSVRKLRTTDGKDPDLGGTSSVG